MDTKPTIGRIELVSLPDLSILAVHARIDTGARTSAIWASSVQEVGDTLEVVFFGKGCEQFTGKVVIFDDYAETVVASSNGASERRYKVKLVLSMGGKRIRTWFTLADRSAQVYPILIGRRALWNKFVVDVAIGNFVLSEAEVNRSKALKRQLEG